MMHWRRTASTLCSTSQTRCGQSAAVARRHAVSCRSGSQDDMARLLTRATPVLPPPHVSCCAGLHQAAAGAGQQRGRVSAEPEQPAPAPVLLLARHNRAQLPLRAGRWPCRSRGGRACSSTARQQQLLLLRALTAAARSGDQRSSAAAESAAPRVASVAAAAAAAAAVAAAAAAATHKRHPPPCCCTSAGHRASPACAPNAATAAVAGRAVACLLLPCLQCRGTGHHRGSQHRLCRSGCCCCCWRWHAAGPACQRLAARLMHVRGLRQRCARQRCAQLSTPLAAASAPHPQQHLPPPPVEH